MNNLSYQAFARGFEGQHGTGMQYTLKITHYPNISVTMYRWDNQTNIWCGIIATTGIVYFPTTFKTWQKFHIEFYSDGTTKLTHVINETTKPAKLYHDAVKYGTEAVKDMLKHMNNKNDFQPMLGRNKHVGKVEFIPA